MSRDAYMGCQITQITKVVPFCFDLLACQRTYSFPVANGTCVEGRISCEFAVFMFVCEVQA